MITQENIQFLNEFEIKLREHRHDDITSRRNIKSPVIVSINLSLASDMIDKNIFISDRVYKIKEVKEVHTTAETTAGTLTLDVKKCAGTTAPASGTTILSSTFDMKGTANTVVSKFPIATNYALKTDDRLALDFSAVATELAGVSITIILETLNA